MIPRPAAAASRVRWRRALGLAGALASALAGALVGASAAFADDGAGLDCTIRFELSGWSAIFERAEGSGTITCADGTSLPVVIHARGAGLTIGQSRINEGTGRFASVRQLDDVIGTYAESDAHAGLVRGAETQLLTNGKASLALAGKGDGYDLGVGIAAFTIVRAP